MDIVNAQQIANKNLLICSPQTPIHQAATLVKQHKTSSILIEENGKIIGIWTEADCAKVCFENSENFSLPINNFMSTPIIAIKSHTPIQEIIMAFHRHRVRHLLVLDENDEPMGITSQTDVIKTQGVERYLQIRKIKDNFNPRVPFVSGDKNLNYVAKKMRDYNSTSAIIFNEEKCVYGIITERDLLRLIANQNKIQTVWHYAAHPLVTIDIEDSLFQAYGAIKQHNLRHLVVRKKDKIVGVLSLQHILSDIEITYIQKLESILNERDTALKESRKSLSIAERIIEASIDSIMVCNGNGAILSVNPAFTQLTGYTASEAIGENASLLSSGLHDKAFYQSMWHSIKHKGRWQGEILNKKKNGDIYSEWLSIVCLVDSDNEEALYAAIFSDITERKQNESRIHSLAFYDELTGLPNRRLFSDRFDIALSTAHRNHQLAAVLFLDLDRFKQINDNLGHKIGDELLKVASERLNRCIKEGDTVSRFGGDEFVVLLTEMTEVKDIIKVVERISYVLSIPYELDEKELHVTSSIGVAIYPDDGKNIDTLLKHADTAMYDAKDSGRNSYKLYSEEMNTASMERLILQNCLQSALKKDEFELFYQLKVHASKQKIVGMEALIRWKNEKLGQVSPGKFITAAEELGLIVDIDLWVLMQACQQRKQWLERGYDCGPISVNISPVHFNHDLLYSIEKTLEATDLPANLLEIEVTENCFIENIDRAQSMLSQIHQLGVSIALDDFGTGYSSLSYLSKLSIDVLKIDASFIAKIPEDIQQCQIVNSIIAMAQALNLKLVAEGVETLEQVEYLTNRGCHICQGYLFSQPMNASATQRLKLRTIQIDAYQLN